MTTFSFPALDAKKRELKAILDHYGIRGPNPTSADLKSVPLAELRDIHTLNDEIGQLQATQRAASDAVAAGGGEPGAENGGQAKHRAAGEHSEAMRTLDGAVKSGLLPEHAAAKTEHLIKRAETAGERGLAAAWTTAAGHPDYMRAFCKLLGDPERGHLLWTTQEHDAYRKVAAVRAEMKAMSLTDANGGYMVPLTLDPAVLLTSDGSINPLRQISRTVQTMTDAWQGVTSAGSTAEWKAEAAEAADASPAVDDAPIPVHFGDAFVPYSFEIGMDAENFAGELQGVLLDAADQLMATAYTTGTGSGQPKGIVTALNNTASELAPAVAETLASGDVYAVQNALPPRFQGRAQWCANLAVINTLAQMETTNGALKFPEIREGRLLRKTLNELSNMDGSINAAATADNFVLLYGDFQQFVIVDRVGTTIEIVPHLIGPNRRPTGQRGAFLWFRTGSDVVIPNAFRVLNVATTA